jgi:hypothetical protein
MTPTISRLTVGLLAFALIASACSSEPADETTTTTTASTTTTTSTTVADSTSSSTSSTTTTVLELVVSEAINGMPAPDDRIDRRVVVVKIDNHPRARPQSGLEIADVVFEIPVEAGITRFMAMFHQSDLDYVGPNRSGRPTDSTIMTSLPGQPFQISGAQPWVQNIFSADDVNVVYDNGATTYRESSRPRPNNLFTSSLLIREWADERGWPDEGPGNLFLFGEPTPGEEKAVVIATPVSASGIPRWEWDGDQYLRFHDDEPHEWVAPDGETGQVGFDTIVVMKMRKYTASPSGEGTPVPAMETVGSGELLVFTNGEVVTGTWERESKTDRFTLLTSDGDPLVLEPARIWVTLVPTSEIVTWE